MTAVGIVALILTTIGHLPTPSAPTNGQMTAAMLAVFVPTGLATWWVFRKLQAHFCRREARSVAIAFAVFAPVSLAAAFLLYAIPASIAGLLLSGSGLVFLCALFGGIAVMTAFLTFLACVFALWITRRIERAEQHDSPKPGPCRF
ncbi:MAG: hypothetical protein ACRD37_00915 [Candidatus Acidiferrales bacterium]